MMKRAPFLLAAWFALPLSAGATPIPRLGVELAERLSGEGGAPRVDHVRLLPPSIAQGIVRWQCELRDALHAATTALAWIANPDGVRIPDVTVLTTEPVARTESSGFGWRDDPFRHRAKFHSGTDFRGKHGTPVLAAADGVVTFARRQGGYGNIIYVDHGGGVITRYAHLQRFHVKPDDVVLAGQRIGAMGSTGRTTGPHLHFEVRLDGRAVDPVMAMSIARLGRAMPIAGKVAALALAPAQQSERTSAHDPPRRPRPPAATKPDSRPESRPDRRDRVKQAKPLS